MMGQQEEEKKTGKEGILLSSSSFDLDLTPEILLRLPAKSVAKSRCVSKLWSSITTLPCFIRSFEARSSKSPCLIISIQVEAKDKLLVFFLPQDQNSNNKKKNKVVVVDSYAMTCPKGWTFLRAHSVNGLICALAPRHLQIWNPTTRRFTSSLENLWTDSVSFLGYDPIGGTYKVLSLPGYPSHADNQPRAQTLGGAQESWRVVQGLTDHAPFRRSGQQCINGVLYYLASPDLSVCNQFLVGFHVRSEKLTRIDVPWTRCCVLMASEGKLVSVLSLGDDITMWTLEEDAEKAEWSCIRRKLPFPSYDPVSETWLELMGINDAGEFIYVQSAVEKEIPFHILYFDAKGNSFRRVVVEGVADDQFRRRNGLGDEPLDITCAYPNHIENLMSFY